MLFDFPCCIERDLDTLLALQDCVRCTVTTVFADTVHWKLTNALLVTNINTVYNVGHLTTLVRIAGVIYAV